MSVVPERFETKRGECRFEDGELVFEESRTGYLRNLYRGYWRSDEWWRKAVFAGYVLGPLSGVFVLAFGRGAIDGRVAVAFGLVFLFGLGLYVFQRHVRGFSRADRISIDAITGITEVRGSKGFTRPRSVLTIRRGGERRRRYVLLPSLSLPGGEDELRRAGLAFEARGFDTSDE